MHGHLQERRMKRILALFQGHTGGLHNPKKKEKSRLNKEGLWWMSPKNGWFCNLKSWFDQPFLVMSSRGQFITKSPKQLPELTTWRIIPISKYLVTPTCKLFRPFGRGPTTRSLGDLHDHHGYENHVSTYVLGPDPRSISFPTPHWGKDKDKVRSGFLCCPVGRGGWRSWTGGFNVRGVYY